MFIDHNPEYLISSYDRVLLRHVELHDCENVNVTGCQLVNVRQRGLLLQGRQVTRIADSTIRGAGDDYLTPLSIGAGCRQVMLCNNFLACGRDGEVRLPAEVGTMTGNVHL